MNKNILVALNIILLAAVGYLYYHNFSAKGSSKIDKENNAKASAMDTGCNRAHIAYVELDSLYENISYIKLRRTDVEVRQKKIESEWEIGMRDLEAKKNNFLKKGAAISQEEAQSFQGQYYQDQQEIESKKQSQMQALGEENFKFTNEIQKSLKEFLAEYNKEKKYMYILTEQ
jgi:outer membrane protein